MDFRKLSCPIGAIVLCSCTPVIGSSPPEASSNGANKAPFELLSQFSSRSVEDPLGRWTARLESESLPKILDEAGFVQLSVPTANGSSLNCFVYDTVLDSGQAVVRFFRAASVGLTFDSFEPTSIDVIAEAPVLFFSGAYTPQSPQERTGTLAFMISPRLQFPLVCSHDSPQADPAFERIVADFLKSFQVSEPAPRPPILSEVWRMDDKSGPLGFWFYRAYEADDQSVTNLSLSSMFRWREGALHTSDSVAVEVEDHDGLLRGRWLQMLGTEKRLEITLERHTSDASASAGNFSYRYLGEQARKRLRGDFQVTSAMHSSFFFQEQLRILSQPTEQGGTEATRRWSQYVPEISLNSETQVQLKAVAANLVQLQRPDSALQMKLGGDDGLPLEISGMPDSAQQAPEVRLTLLQRTGPAVSAGPP